MSRRRESRGAMALAGVGLTQGEVAEQAGLNQRTVGRVLQGLGGGDARAATFDAIRILRGDIARREVLAGVLAEREGAA